MYFSFLMLVTLLTQSCKVWKDFPAQRDVWWNLPGISNQSDSWYCITNCRESDQFQIETIWRKRKVFLFCGWEFSIQLNLSIFESSWIIKSFKTGQVFLVPFFPCKFLCGRSRKSFLIKNNRWMKIILIGHNTIV